MTCTLQVAKAMRMKLLPSRESRKLSSPSHLEL